MQPSKVPERPLHATVGPCVALILGSMPSKPHSYSALSQSCLHLSCSVPELILQRPGAAFFSALSQSCLDISCSVPELPSKRRSLSALSQS